MSSEQEISHAGVVRAIDGDQALVAVQVAGCAGCGQRRGCSIGRLAGTSEKTVLVHVATPPGVQAGDAVRLAIGQDAAHRAALLGYLLPAMLMVAGGVAGQFVGAGDGAAVLGALAGLATGIAFPRIIAAFVPLSSALTLHIDRP